MDRAALMELETTLYWLRWCAVAGQTISLFFAGAVLGLDLPWTALGGGVATLALANSGVALWRSRHGISEHRVLFGLAFDIAALTWALFFSGGVMNPFTMLYLLPVALTATVLPASRVIGLAVAGIVSYGLLAQWAPPLPHVHGQGALDLHLAGMGVNFLLSMGLLCAFGLRLAYLLRGHAEALRRARERVLRDEGMHALALQAAVAAHSVNTPLATLTLLIDELRAAPPDPASLAQDLDLAARQLALARLALRRLTDAGTHAPPAPRALSAVLDELAERAALLRPTVTLRTHCEARLASRRVCLPAVLLASLGNLLDNAADADGDSEAGIDLHAESDGPERLCLRILDRGAGLRVDLPPGVSDKDHGLGWGLALANATLESSGGELHQRPREGGGTELRVRLPWKLLEGRA
jgi:two-component system sensor histidine kinase RegB